MTAGRIAETATPAGLIAGSVWLLTRRGGMPAWQALAWVLLGLLGGPAAAIGGQAAGFTSCLACHLAARAAAVAGRPRWARRRRWRGRAAAVCAVLAGACCTAGVTAGVGAGSGLGVLAGVRFVTSPPPTDRRRITTTPPPRPEAASTLMPAAAARPRPGPIRPGRGPARIRIATGLAFSPGPVNESE